MFGTGDLKDESARAKFSPQFYVHTIENKNGYKNEYLPTNKDGYNYITQHNHRYVNKYVILHVSSVLLGFLFTFCPTFQAIANHRNLT